ncbi:MAG: efflux RND transporter periplasmic adaptor subunit [Planctomycetota bacterium]
MLPTFVYVTAFLILLLALAVLSSTRRGRATVLESLPGAVLLVLLIATAEVAFAVGRSQGGTESASGAIYTCSMHWEIRVPEPGMCPVCHMELVVLGSAEAIGGSAHEITIDPTVVQNMGVRLHRAERGPMQRSVRAFGELRATETGLFDVALKFDGFVEELFADTLGMRIEKGEALFSIYAPELLVAQSELIAAVQSGDQALVEAAKSKFALWDVSATEIDRLASRTEPLRAIPWSSPVSGVLLQKNVVEGAPAPKSTMLVRIADLSTLWLDAQVPAQQLSALREGIQGTVTFDELRDQERKGTVTFVAPEVDRTTRTGTVRLLLDNRDFALRPGMWARVRFAVPVADDAVLVPSEAVLDTGRRQIVWVAVGKGRFAPRVVTVGATSDEGLVEVRTGIEGGDLVVVSGQFLIDSESRLREGTRKFESEGTMKGGDLPPPESVPLSAASQQAIDALAAAYVAATEAFAQDRFELPLLLAVRVAADAVVTTATEQPVQLPATELAKLLDKPSTDLEAARVHWKQVSQLALRLFEVARPSGADGAAFFVHHCPMAEADWLQLDGATRNPYYGSSMLECGAVRRSLPLHEGAGK